jgi:hypothetical protein
MPAYSFSDYEKLNKENRGLRRELEAANQAVEALRGREAAQNWQEESKKYQENGGCPACFEFEGHKKGCYIDELEEKVRQAVEREKKLKDTLGMVGMTVAAYEYPAKDRLEWIEKQINNAISPSHQSRYHAALAVTDTAREIYQDLREQVFKEPYEIDRMLKLEKTLTAYDKAGEGAGK